jgi:hypothetical protein
MSLSRLVEDKGVKSNYFGKDTQKIIKTQPLLKPKI